MKVEVNRIKKPGVKVSVTLVRAKRAGGCIGIPVRTVAKDEIFPETESAGMTIGFAATAEDPAEGFVIACDVIASEEAEESVADESACENAADDDISDDTPEEAPDEEDLLALIEEEEAEMALHMQQQHEAVAQPFTDCAPSDSEPEEESADPEAVPDEDQPAQVSQYMRYFDRRNDGEKVEVSDARANAQEIICVDEESGRLSRVCGFIKNNQSAQSSNDSDTDIQE